ncbi:MAG: hypothetical protein AAF404_19325, partial [Pseudomonadota bacterium]
KACFSAELSVFTGCTGEFVYSGFFVSRAFIARRNVSFELLTLFGCSQCERRVKSENNMEPGGCRGTALSLLKGRARPLLGALACNAKKRSSNNG